MTQPLGALDLPFNIIGEAVQSLGSVLVDRGHDAKLVKHALTEHFDETDFWQEVLGPAVNRLAEYLDLEHYPDET